MGGDCLRVFAPGSTPPATAELTARNTEGNIMKSIAWVAAVLAAAGVAASAADSNGFVTVRAKTKPANAWKEYPTRTLAALPGFDAAAPGPAQDGYGGRADRAEKATGFFHAKKAGGRWWLIDPEGHPFLHVGVATVNLPHSAGVEGAYRAKFGTPAGWAEQAAALLRSNHFNGTGAWSDNELLRATKAPVVYTVILNFISDFGHSRKLTHVVPGHTGFRDDCMPVFHPDFPAFCEGQARKKITHADDPWLLGYFSDNELPAARLEKFLGLDPADAEMAACREAAHTWLAKRKGKADAAAKDITQEDRDAFAGFVFDRYFEITTAAIRRCDPHHLCLGSRYHSIEKKIPSCFAAAGKYLDVIAVNLYGQWTPDLTMLRDWERWSGKPCLITEWYTKGEDSGMKNTTGAGWIVPTQADRGRFYQNFTLALLESKVCVGWHWFKYQDNDPANAHADPSNLDANKGIVNLQFEPYAPLLGAAKELNGAVYRLADWFDKP